MDRFSRDGKVYTILERLLGRGKDGEGEKKELPSPSGLTTNFRGAEQGWHCQVERKRKADFFLGGKSDED